MVEGDDLTNHIVRLANVISDPTIDDNALDQAIHWWWLPTGAHDTVTAFFLASLCNRLLESEHYLPRIQPSDVFVDANPIDWYAAHPPAPPALVASQSTCKHPSHRSDLRSRRTRSHGKRMESWCQWHSHENFVG